MLGILPQISRSSSRLSSAISLLPNECLLEIFSFLSEIHKCLINKDWEKLIDHSEVGNRFWENISIREGVPLVEKGKSKNVRSEFQFLRLLTLSRRVMGQYLGEAVEIGFDGKEIEPEPRYIRFDRFQELVYSGDPLEPRKFMRHNYLVVVPPRYFKIRVSRENRPLDLDKLGTTLREVPETEEMDEKDLVIPFSLRNLKMLTKYPLAGGNHGPCFSTSVFSALGSDIFEKYESQAPVQAPWDSIFIMRKESINPYCVDPEHGLEIVPLSLRGLTDVLLILSSGTCPDSRVRDNKKILHSGRNYIMRLGGFVPGKGRNVLCCPSDMWPSDPVALGIPAEAVIS